MIIDKLEILYWLYLFGLTKQVVSIYPFVFKTRPLYQIPLSYEDFKVEFEALCKKWTYTVDDVYEKLRNTILFLRANGVFNFEK